MSVCVGVGLCQPVSVCVGLCQSVSVWVIKDIGHRFGSLRSPSYLLGLILPSACQSVSALYQSVSVCVGLCQSVSVWVSASLCQSVSVSVSLCRCGSSKILATVSARFARPPTYWGSSYLVCVSLCQSCVSLCQSVSVCASLCQSVSVCVSLCGCGSSGILATVSARFARPPTY